MPDPPAPPSLAVGFTDCHSYGEAPRRLKTQRSTSWSTRGRLVRASAVRVWAVSLAQARTLPWAARLSAR
ncbi:hypothetical protein [Streptomyces sp. SudanB66_2053]|uniref:hypothetical protein n=1 Tax=Streptomyces sp. SudanB66_2053 TaxID=3035277 RepID=UPI003F57EF12